MWRGEQNKRFKDNTKEVFEWFASILHLMCVVSVWYPFELVIRKTSYIFFISTFRYNWHNHKMYLFFVVCVD